MMSPTSMVSSTWLSLPSTVSSTTYTHDVNVVTNVEIIKILHFNHQNHSIFHPSWRKFKTEVTHPNVSDLHPNISDLPGLLLQVFLAVPSVVDHQLSCTKCCQNVRKKLRSTSITAASHPRWRKTQLKWYILISEISLVFSSRLFLPSTVPSTTNLMFLMLSNMLEI